jgi:hypothetical protein
MIAFAHFVPKEERSRIKNLPLKKPSKFIF